MRIFECHVFKRRLIVKDPLCFVKNAIKKEQSLYITVKKTYYLSEDPVTQLAELDLILEQKVPRQGIFQGAVCFSCCQQGLAVADPSV